MRKGWKESTLGDLVRNGAATLQTGPFGTMLNASEYVLQGTPIIAVQDIGDNRLSSEKLNYVGKETESRLSRYKVKVNDIIFGRKGAVDRRALITEKEEGWIQGSDCIRLRLIDGNDAKFVSYQLGSNRLKKWLFQYAHGATMPSLNQEILSLLPLVIPTLSEQRAIAGVLSSLDDKIDLLHRQNKTLEGMAEALWRKMFVEDADPGWPLKRLSDLCLITRGASPRPIIDFVSNGTVPWIKIADATASNSCVIDATNEFIIEDGVAKSVKVFPGDLILSNSATCGLPFFVGLYGCIHDGWLLFREFKEVSKYFVFFFLKQLNKELNYIADGSVQNNLNTGILKEYPLQVPARDRIITFDRTVELAVERIKKNALQVRTLSRLRDTLLPKLMSGEVRVKM